MQQAAGDGRGLQEQREEVPQEEAEQSLVLQGGGGAADGQEQDAVQDAQWVAGKQEQACGEGQQPEGAAEEMVKQKQVGAAEEEEQIAGEPKLVLP